MEKYEEAGRWWSRAASKPLHKRSCGYGLIIEPNIVGANSYENHHANTCMDTKHTLTC